MQINGYNPVVSDNQTKQPNKTKENTSFKGLGPVDTVALGVANAIENGGLAVSFTLQDMLGTNLPRPIMGLARNSKENKGEKNFKFAAKEMVREFTTGPSMFLIPMGMLAAGKKAIGATVNTPMAFIKAFGDIHAKNPVNEAGKAISKRDFFKNTFTEIIKNAKSETAASKQTIEKATEFAEELASANKENLKETIGKLSGEFVTISKSHAKDAAHTDFTQAVVSGKASGSFADVVSHMKEYADDIVTKAAKNPSEGFVTKLVDNKALTRFGANALMFASVMTFLQVIPKLYNKAEGKGNAGLKGLMTEETLNGNQPAPNNPQKNKSNPSFGSAATVVQKATGNGLLGKFARAIEFEGPNVSFPLLVNIMGFGILAPRIKNAKDKYDRQEILRRDVTTCVVMCYGEKALRKGFSKLNEKNSGLVLASKDAAFQKKGILGKVIDYIRPIKGVNVMSTPQIAAKYSGLDKYKDGITGFCNFIDNQGGNLKKVFSLTDESKSIVGSLLEKEGKSLQNADNKVITEVLTKAKGSEDLKKLTDLFKGTTKDTNPWIKKAQTCNARFTALSVLVLVPAFLGFMLPWINERATKKQINSEAAQRNANKNNSPFSNAQYFIKDRNLTGVFNDMKK